MMPKLKVILFSKKCLLLLALHLLQNRGTTMYLLLLAVIYLAFISLGLPDSLLGSAWPTIHAEFNVPISLLFQALWQKGLQEDLAQAGLHYSV